MDLKNFREIIREKPLLESEVSNDPFGFLKQWIQEAIDSGIRQPNAMNLATVDLRGNPQSRVVLLKEFIDGHLSFFTCYDSPKAKEIDRNSHVALNFLWFDINRQVRVLGKAKKSSKEYSENYFKSRPRDSQIAATISLQSGVISNREVLETKYREFEEKYKDKEIPFPSNWGGYLVEPSEFEFWQGRSGRLHDRLRFIKEGQNWTISRLSP